jgi:hypothetical protein
MLINWCKRCKNNNNNCKYKEGYDKVKNGIVDLEKDLNLTSPLRVSMFCHAFDAQDRNINVCLMDRCGTGVGC